MTTKETLDAKHPTQVNHTAAVNELPEFLDKIGLLTKLGDDFGAAAMADDPIVWIEGNIDRIGEFQSKLHELAAEHQIPALDVTLRSALEGYSALTGNPSPAISLRSNRSDEATKTNDTDDGDSPEPPTKEEPKDTPKKPSTAVPKGKAEGHPKATYARTSCLCGVEGMIEFMLGYDAFAAAANA